MILEWYLITTCDSILKKLNEKGYILEKTINYSNENDWDDYYFFINKDEAIEISIAYGQSNWFIDKKKIRLAMYKPWINIDKFDSSEKIILDNRWLEVNEDSLFEIIMEFLER